MSRFWLQVQAPAGNWADRLGSDKLSYVVEHGDYLRNQHGERTRVVERFDIPVSVNGKQLREVENAE